MLKGKKILAPSLIFISILFLTACGSSGPEIRVENAWIRPDPLFENGAGYFIVYNDGGEADTLLSIRTDIAKESMMHQTKMEGDVHKMEMVMRLEIPAGGSVEFKPLVYHIMMTDLADGLEYGQTAALIFVFEKSGEIEVQAEIRAE